MSALPGNLRYGLSRLSQFSTNKFRLQTLNQTSAVAGDIVEVRLPTNSLCDMKSLSFHAHASVAANLAGTTGKMPRGGLAGLVERIEVLAGGQVLSQGFPEYSAYNICKNNTADSYNKWIERKVLQGSDINQGALAPVNVPYVMPIFHGFVGSVEPTFLALDTIPEISVRIYLKGNYVCPLNAGAAVPALSPAIYSLSDIYFTIDSVGLPAAFGEMVEQKMVEQGFIEMPYKQTFSFNQSNAGAAATNRFSVSSQSIDEMLAVMRPTDASVGAFLPQAYNAAQIPIDGGAGAGVDSVMAELSADTCFFDNGIDSARFSLNNLYFPTYEATSADWYNAHLTAKAETYEANSGDIVNSLLCWQNAMWCAQVRLSHPGDDAERLISGYDSRGSNSIATFETKATAAGRANQTTIFATTHSVLRAGAGRQIQVLQ